MNEEVFKELLVKLCAEQAKSLGPLIVEGEWKVGDEKIVQHLKGRIDGLLNHLIRRAYLFGEYRVNGNRDENAPALPVELKYSDLYKAWETIAMDATQ